MEIYLNLIFSALTFRRRSFFHKPNCLLRQDEKFGNSLDKIRKRCYNKKAGGTSSEVERAFARPFEPVGQHHRREAEFEFFRPLVSYEGAFGRL